MNNKNVSLKDKTLAELRKHAVVQVKQAVVALEMSIQEPAVSKLERKPISTMQVDKLKRYVAAIGGSMKLMITLPDGSVLSLED
jgi:predicted XRE-type DNA-binding protein